MNISLNAVQASANANYVSEEALQQAGAEQDIAEATPEQPLFGAVVSLTALWRLVKEQLALVADATSGTAKESNDAKRSLIDLQRDTQIEDLKTRDNNLREQKRAQEANKILGGIIFAFSLLAALITMPFNPVVGCIMLGTLVASIVVPIVVDKILEAAGVDKATRDKVRMGLEIGISLLGAIISLNPLQMIKSIGSAVANGVRVGAQTVINGLKSLPTVLSNIKWVDVGKSIGEAATKAGTKIADMVQNLAQTMKAFFQSMASGSKSTASLGSSLANKWQDLKVIVQATMYTVTNALKTAGSTAATALKSAWEALKNADEILNGVMAALRTAGQNFVEMMRNLGVYLRAFGHAMRTAPGETLKATMNDFLDWVGRLATTFDKAQAVRVNQVTTIASTATSTVQAGYAVASAAIATETEVRSAQLDEVLTIIQTVLEQLNSAMRLFQQALQSLMTLNSDYRDFIQRQIAANHL